MIATRHWRSVLSVAFWLCLLLAPRYALADPNATITNGNVQLRQSYPSFGFSTLLRFRLVPGRILKIIPEGSRVEVSRKRIVAKTQEWFETTYVTGTERWTGWVYAGQIGSRRYIRLDPGVERQIPVADVGGREARFEMSTEARQLLFSPSAHAQVRINAVEPPIPETDPIRTLFLGLAYVLIFIGSLFATKKWIFPTSNIYSMATGLCVLLVLGFISETTLSGLIAELIVP